jgi:Ran GTPase-activating protein (RanGAP) involved in mRNA processing and transport
MNHCGLGDSEAHPLSDTISKHNSMLTNLSIKNNKIKHKGASFIFKAMVSQASCIVSIDLSFNLINDECSDALCHLIENGPR